MAQDVVRTLTIRTREEGADAAAGSLNKVATAYDNVARSADAVATATDRPAKSQLSMVQAFERQERKYVDGVRQALEFEKVQRQVGAAVGQYPALQERANAVLSQAAERLGIVGQALERARAEQESYNKAMNSASSVNQRMGVKDDFGTQARGADIVAYGKQLDDLRAKYNPLFAAGRQYKDALTEINTAAKVGAISEKERVAAIAQTKTAFVEQVGAIQKVSTATQASTKAIGLNRYEMLNLSRQAQDVVVSLAGGQSLGVVLTQQGSQILDVFQAANGSVRGFATQAIGWLGRFATSAVGAASGALAIGAGALYAASSWQESQREIDKALIGIGRRSGVTAKDINEIARTGATATGLSVDQARDAALEFVKTGAIFKDNIKSAVAVTNDFAIVTGKNAKEAAQDLGAALATPVEGADALNKQLGFLDGRTREYIATLVSQNQKQEAQAVLLRNLAPAIQAATNTLGPFEKAWNAVANAASTAKNAIGEALTPRTDEQRRDALVQSINQRSIEPLEGTPRTTSDMLDSSKIKLARVELEALNEKLRESGRARALAFPDDAKISLDADNAVRELLPYIDQLKKVEEQINRIKAAQVSPGAKDRQGLGDSNEAAARAAEVLKMNIQATADETARANTIALELAKSYNTASIEVARALAIQQEHLAVASAVGGAARLAAQEQATYTQLIIEGKTAEDAAALATSQRAVAQAQITAAAQEQVFQLQNQLPVMSAVTEQQKVQAQYQATINQLVRDSVPLVQAIAVAEGQRALSVAQANADADRMLKKLQEQGQLIRAASEEERGRIQAAQTYQQLLEKNVDSQKAGAVAAQMQANARSTQDAREEAQAEQDAARAAGQRAQAAQAAAAATERMAVAAAEAARRFDVMAEKLKFLPFYLIDTMGTVNSLFDTADGGKSQFDPKGYTSGNNYGKVFDALGIKIPEGTNKDINYWIMQEVNKKHQENDKKAFEDFKNSIKEIDGSMPTAEEFARYQAEGLYSQTGSASAAANLLINGGAFNGSMIGRNDISNDNIQTQLNRLIGLMDDPSKIKTYQSEIDQLNATPQTLARDELIKSLTDSLKQVQDALDGNTDALNAQLDPLMSQGHDYLNSLKLGYYHAASGLSGIVRGAGGTDSTPVHMMLTPGEHLQVTPPGQFPRAANSNVSSDNSKTIVNHNTITIKGADTPEQRLRARQLAQGFISAANRAASAA